MSHLSWWASAQKWLCEKATAHFSLWAASDDAATWRKNTNRSPYLCGYVQPDWMHEMRNALGKNDEHRVKRIKLDNL
jgi:hypothetical protein